MNYILNILQAEWLKLKGYKTFWIMLALHFLGLILIAWGLDYLGNKILKSTLGNKANFLSFPITEYSDIWLHLTWLAVFIRFFLGMLVITTITNEFSYKTARQNIIDGWSREHFFLAKVCQIFILVSLSTLFLVLISLVMALMSNASSLAYFFSKIDYLFYYFLQVLVYLSFCLLLGILIRRSGLAIVILMAYAMFELYLIGKTFDKDHLEIATFFPFNTPFNILQPSILKYLPVTISKVEPQVIDFLALSVVFIYIGVFLLGTYFFLKRKDI